MDTQSYIASGKLELFVLGELSQEEREEVLEMAGKHPEIKRELEEIQEAMFAFDKNSGPSPSSEVKGKIFDTLLGDAESKSETKPVDKVTPEIPVAKWKAFAVAATVAAIIATAFAIYFAVQYNEVDEKFTSLMEERNVLSEKLQVNETKFQQTHEQLETLLGGDFRRIPLSGSSLDVQKDARVDVFWEQQSQEVFVNVNKLAQLEDEFDYQLWAIGDEGPVGIGLVKIEEGISLQQMESVANAGAFAITIEPKGGSETPTLEKMVVIGENV
ncbi:anti-sigma factor [Echinicola jeungdonensis]|uniref:Anti-sigma factor n=1 Tax=Echinicola jeungdonensis TaxID=709343 RepID=A0ABV5J2Q6_9BACT|nr:anti-sigma factor [Echinicola jeungdonensis]MDN3668161.1 anti-sigma factor [Echinicola jeungdonensis]